MKKLTADELKNKFKLDSTSCSQLYGKGLEEKVDGKWVYDTRHPLIKVLIKYGKEPLITKSEAKNEFRIKDNELEKLNSFKKSNPHYKSGPPMQLFFQKQIKDFVAKYPRRERKITEKKIPEITSETIAESLYVINKKAKEYRNKGKDYSENKNELYYLKDQVLEKVIEKKMGEVKGYHIQRNLKYEEQMEIYEEKQFLYGEDNYFFNPEKEFYLKLIEIACYTYHIPITEPEGKYLGEIGIISALKQPTKIKLPTAKLLLESFLKIE